MGTSGANLKRKIAQLLQISNANGVERFLRSLRLIPMAESRVKKDPDDTGGGRILVGTASWSDPGFVEH
jgi:hypothetical protein